MSDRRATAVHLARTERRIGTGRLGVFAIALLAAWLAFAMHRIGWGWFAIAVVGFIALVLAHARVIPSRRRADRRVHYYERGLARLEDRWIGGGTSGDRYTDPGHPYSGDLDVFGVGSLFELLCTARTRVGEDTLAAWLAAPAPREEIVARQAAVAELRDRLDLREQIAIAGADVGDALHAEALAAWASAPPILGAKSVRIGAALLAGAAALAAIGWGAGLIGPAPFAAALLAEAALAAVVRVRVRTVLRAVELPGRDLRLLAELLGRIERERFTAARLERTQAALVTAGKTPSARIAQLQRLINLLDARRNQLFALVAPLLLWSTQLACAIEAWRATSGAAVGRWLVAVGDFEALSALATYAYERGDEPFAEIAASEAGFEAEDIGHPLLPSHRCVRNHVRLGGAAPALLVVSGSNMSGKSTLLRTVGINAVLAQAGAPVRARYLRMSALTVGTSMRIADSLQAGTSRFYAEIQRLRQLVDLAQGPRPLLFLLDEILHGTNSHDRRLGAEAVVRGLLTRRGIGLITTHDLSLASIADALAPRAANVHFEDHLENGQMTFDYRMRPGVVRKSNALELMRAVGLEV